MAKAIRTVGDDDAQIDMFPELDMTKPGQKKLFQAARAYHSAKSQRAELLSTAKEKEDNAMQRLISMMHEEKITCFKHKGVRADLITTKEKAQVKLEDETPEDEASDD